MSKKELKIKCPKCEKEINYYESKYRPFCSERCEKIDLGHWVSESYSIPSKEPVSDDEKKDE